MKYTKSGMGYVQGYERKEKEPSWGLVLLIVVVFFGLIAVSGWHALHTEDEWHGGGMIMVPK